MTSPDSGALQPAVASPNPASPNPSSPNPSSPDALRLLPVRTATAGDLDALDAVEQACFPPAEAASRDTLAARIAVYPDCFWLLEGIEPEGIEPEGAESTSIEQTPSGDADRAHRGNTPTLLSFVNGMATDEPHLRDEMYDDPSLHSPDGAWQMIFGVDTHPAFRRRGYAGMVLRRVIDDARSHGRRGLVLTCKDRLVHYYASFGFVDEGMSDSTHGGVAWHEMRLTFESNDERIAGMTDSTISGRITPTADAPTPSAFSGTTNSPAPASPSPALSAAFPDLASSSPALSAAFPDLASPSPAPSATGNAQPGATSGGKLVVAFICTHNSCRSQIAEALASEYARTGRPGFDRFTFVSAGTSLKDTINPDAQRLMLDQYGIDMSARGQHPKLISDIPRPDIAISMGCGVRCPFIGRPFDDDWELDDPTGHPDEEFLAIMDAIDQRVRAIPATYGR